MKPYVMTFVLALFMTSFSFAQISKGVDAGPITTMEFEEDRFDFGTITSGEVVSYVYFFKNTGTEPLVILNAKGSCGCTVPEWPKTPIAPGETGVIEVQFNSKGKTGKQSKRVTITANTNPKQTYLIVTGEIKPKENATIDKGNEVTIEIPQEDLNNSNWEKPLTDDCFAIFPNPTTEVLKLELKEHLGKTANITIFNSTGVRMTNRAVKEISNEIIEFNVIDFAEGTYYVKIQIGKESVSTKCFVVAKK